MYLLFSLSHIHKDKNNDGKVTQQELNEFLSNLNSESRRDVLQALVRLGEDIKHGMLRKVFEALDTNKDGKVDRNEVLMWLLQEDSWQQAAERIHANTKVPFTKIRERVYHDIDRYPDGEITFDELEAFFSTWSLREIRQFTSNELFYRDLSAKVKQATLSKKKASEYFKEQGDKEAQLIRIAKEREQEESSDEKKTSAVELQALPSPKESHTSDKPLVSP